MVLNGTFNTTWYSEYLCVKCLKYCINISTNWYSHCHILLIYHYNILKSRPRTSITNNMIFFENISSSTCVCQHKECYKILIVNCHVWRLPWCSKLRVPRQIRSRNILSFKTNKHIMPLKTNQQFLSLWKWREIFLQ